ncbi:6-phosphogluconolactonase [Phytoactinopolyspora halotolerans]|uniref:Glucosamine-6-phosphate deaminase n=1 Tax=Phytoactinopolyspora halotolerans TaxID=1981512 RepID=A0A6L9SAF0_9ACTN|nr:6-phosphogluconolactonase [Phytoactinopolyspora halotolerans]NEE02236.1 glucosamine-6-phosphate deaminase [Phytoactinopolyspora halotolerans]
MSTPEITRARSTTVDRLRVRVHDHVDAAGRAAAALVAQALRQRIDDAGEARIMFAAAPSQDAVLHALCRERDVDWSRVTAFQMDEYVGLDADHPQAFGTYLQEHIYTFVRPGRVHLMRPDGDGAQEAERYAALLGEAPIDVVCLGIGENGHIAFNDPGIADFEDPFAVKVVELDPASRRQQVHDGCFPSVGDVPTHAVTVTVPALLSASVAICSVPGARKRAAVQRALTGEVSEDCPASALRRHPDGWLFLDPASTPDDLLRTDETTA